MPSRASRVDDPREARRRIRPLLGTTALLRRCEQRVDEFIR